MEKEMSFNLKVISTKNEVMKIVVDSKLPATVIQMILAEIKHAVDMETEQIIKNENEEYQNIDSKEKQYLDDTDK